MRIDWRQSSGGADITPEWRKTNEHLKERCYVVRTKEGHFLSYFASRDSILRTNFASEGARRFEIICLRVDVDSVCSDMAVSERIIIDRSVSVRRFAYLQHRVVTINCITEVPYISERVGRYKTSAWSSLHDHCHIFFLSCLNQCLLFIAASLGEKSQKRSKEVSAT